MSRVSCQRERQWAPTTLSTGASSHQTKLVSDRRLFHQGNHVNLHAWVDTGIATRQHALLASSGGHFTSSCDCSVSPCIQIDVNVLGLAEKKESGCIHHILLNKCGYTVSARRRGHSYLGMSSCVVVVSCPRGRQWAQTALSHGRQSPNLGQWPMVGWRIFIMRKKYRKGMQTAKPKSSVGWVGLKYDGCRWIWSWACPRQRR